MIQLLPNSETDTISCRNQFLLVIGTAFDDTRYSGAKTFYRAARVLVRIVFHPGEQSLAGGLVLCVGKHIDQCLALFGKQDDVQRPSFAGCLRHRNPRAELCITVRHGRKRIEFMIELGECCARNQRQLRVRIRPIKHNIQCLARIEHRR